ncbi:MAG: hypothetical protein RMK31_02845 [Candidatus Caldarchaeum sp.]|nr:hypothetical protein [Candidatus Caldarchaeum sp.]
MAGLFSSLTVYRAVLTILIAVIMYFMVIGFGPLLERQAGGFRPMDLKGEGWLGYRLGYAGALLLLSAQVYLFRPGFLTKAAWLDTHCYLTTLGGALTLLHAGFPYSFSYWTPPRLYPELGIYGLIGFQGVAAWLVLGLIASGFFGRYVYRRVARARWGRVFKWWHALHSVAAGMLYVAGFIHLLIAVQLKYLTAV